MRPTILAVLPAAGTALTIVPVALAQQAATVSTAPNPNAKYKVVFQACDNTMHSMKLTNSDLIGGISHVDAGVVELMMKQRAGWSYIRP